VLSAAAIIAQPYIATKNRFFYYEKSRLIGSSVMAIYLNIAEREMT
jgi:hypothetical protein